MKLEHVDGDRALLRAYPKPLSLGIPEIKLADSFAGVTEGNTYSRAFAFVNLFSGLIADPDRLPCHCASFPGIKKVKVTLSLLTPRYGRDV